MKRHSTQIALQKHLRRLNKLSLRKGKTQGYGGNPRKFVDPLLPRFKVLTYKKGPYLVIDRYSGEDCNVGQAITYYRMRPIYGLNYYGILLNRRFEASTVFEFLKKALRAGAGKSSHRGLDGFREKDFHYRNRFTDHRGFVIGEEKIFYHNIPIYIQLYHGGLIVDTRRATEWSRHLHPANELWHLIPWNRNP